jgi:hypothetical protein
MTEADAAFHIANNDECRETEALAALHRLCDAVDVNQLVSEFTVFPLTVAATAASAVSFWRSCHFGCLS